MKTTKSGRGRRGSKKGRQQVANKARGKYVKAFVRCVERTGRWRGKPATLAMAYKKTSALDISQ